MHNLVEKPEAVSTVGKHCAGASVGGHSTFDPLLAMCAMAIKDPQQHNKKISCVVIEKELLCYLSVGVTEVFKVLQSEDAVFKPGLKIHRD